MSVCLFVRLSVPLFVCLRVRTNEMSGQMKFQNFELSKNFRADGFELNTFGSADMNATLSARHALIMNDSGIGKKR